MSRPELAPDGMQHERTSLAWERTAIAGMVTGLLVTRVAASIHLALAPLGIVQVCLGAALLVWSGRRYEELHGASHAGGSPAHPDVARLVGGATTVAIGVATVLAVLLALLDR